MTPDERQGALAAVDEFRDIGQDARAALAASMREEVFAPGELVLTAGEEASRMFILCEGALEVTQPGRHGVVRRLERGAMLGEIAFFSGSARTANVRALERSVLLSLPFDNFRAFLFRNPQSLLALTTGIVRALRDLERAVAARVRVRTRPVTTPRRGS